MELRKMGKSQAEVAEDLPSLSKEGEANCIAASPSTTREKWRFNMIAQWPSVVQNGLINVVRPKVGFPEPQRGSVEIWAMRQYRNISPDELYWSEWYMHSGVRPWALWGVVGNVIIFYDILKLRRARARWCKASYTLYDARELVHLVCIFYGK